MPWEELCETHLANLAGNALLSPDVSAARPAPRPRRVLRQYSEVPGITR